MKVGGSILMAAVLLLSACADRAVNGSPGGSTRGPKPIVGFPEAVIQRSLEAILGDLKRIQSEFPQLSEIERAVIAKSEGGQFRLNYQKGFVKDDRLQGPTFEKDGCDVFVEMRYPASREDAGMRPIPGQAFPTRNGSYIAVWHLERADRTDGGRAFSVRAGQVISARLEQMKEDLARSE